MFILIAALLAIVAGALTTVAGVGGGMLLVLALSLLVDPRLALAATAPALLLSNLHRFAVYRQEVDPKVAKALLIGALPGSFLGGMLLLSVPIWAIRGLMIGSVALTLLRAAGLIRVTISPKAIVPSAFLIGGLSATSGGAGVLVGPLLLASGLKGRAYVATTAVAGVSMHLGRSLSYGMTGLFSRETLTLAAVLTGMLVVGNLIGVQIRKALKEATSTRIEVGSLVVCVALAAAGIAR